MTDTRQPRNEDSDSWIDRIPPYYDRDFVEREFTPERILRQGERLLSRALNIGQAIGFVGSGVSAAYGRPSWTELINEAGRAVQDTLAGAVAGQDCDADSGECAASLDPEETRLKNTQDIIDLLTPANGAGMSDADTLTLRAHLYRTLRAGYSPREREEDVLQAKVKAMVADDDYVCRSKWQALIVDPNGRPPLDGDLVKRLGKATEAEAWEAPALWRAIDTFACLEAAIAALRQVLPGHGASLAEIGRCLKQRRVWLDRIDTGPGKGDCRRLSVEERFLVPLLAALAPLEARADIQRRLLRVAGRLLQATAPDSELWRSADGERSPICDPIKQIYGDLTLRRLLTVNYDFELERGLERLGFEPARLRPPSDPAAAPAWVGDLPASGELVVDRPRGERARSMVFRRETAADLAGFAVHAGHFDYEIFHLHGRAIRVPEEPLVITERDYQRVYMRDAPEAHVMDEALRAVMAGNPIVFLGMGMGEADLLRPLRRFVAGPGALANRSIVALMPAEQGLADRTLSALQLYLRYGVHAVFYGRWPGQDDTGTRLGPEEQQLELEWWPTSVRAQHGDQPFHDEPVLYRSIARTRALHSAFGDGVRFDKLRKCLDEGPDPFSDIESALRAFKPPSDSDDLPLKALALLKKAISGATRGDQLRYCPFLWELDSRIRSRALCSRLAQSAQSRRKWWRQWREPPKVRSLVWNVEERVAPGEWRLGRTRMQAQLLDPKEEDQPTIRGIRYRVYAADLPQEIEAEEAARHQRIADAIIGGTDKAKGRRIFVVHGAEGDGRGSFLRYLSDHFADKDPQAYGWGLFTSAAFSSEYSSVIDGTIAFLQQCTVSPTTHMAEKINARAQQAALVRRSRRDAVRHYLSKMYPPGGRKNRRRGRRGLLFIGNSEVLFRSQNGSPKNFELVQSLGAFLDKEAKDYPLDIVLMCQTDNCKTIFGQEPPGDGSKTKLSFGQGETFVPPRKGAMDSDAARPPSPRLRPAQKPVKFKAVFVGLRADEDDSLDSGNLARVVTKGAVALFKTLARDASGPGVIESFVREPGDWNGAMAGRFGSSMVLRCALETFERYGGDSEATASGAASDKPEHKMAVEKTGQFIIQLGDAVSRADRERASDVTINHVLGQYRRLDENRPPAGGADDAACDPDLRELILKHLAIISGPVEVEVLARCPDIREHLARHPIAGQDDTTRIGAQLVWLAERRLASQIQARNERMPPGKTTARFERFAVHRHIQHYFFRRIGAPYFQTGDGRLFTVSTFASQPTDLPAPSRSAYEFMLRLIRCLVGYPPVTFERGQARTEDRRVEDACALRAAVQLVRSAFSFAVVSRFEEFATVSPADRGPFGYLEEYRLILRWMIYQAGLLGIEPTLDDQAKRNEIRGRLKTETLAQDPTEATLHGLLLKERFNALYQDEITWLYNECAIVSFTQGNLYDAIALFERAEHSNNRVEAQSNRAGPNGLRLRLNQAVVHLERGHLTRAARELRFIYEHRQLEPVIGYVARGYLGLTAHLRGRAEQAERYYAEAIEVLRHFRESRAVAIFARHHGDLLRSRDRNASDLLLKSALAEAETARQHDLVHKIQVSMALNEINAPGRTPETARRVLRRLDNVLNYAEHMEIYTLKIEALLARAMVIDLQGETRGAGEEAVAALSLANLHGQRLRATMGLLRLGAIMGDRPRYGEQGSHLLRTARQIAASHDYQLAQEQVERRLLRPHALP